MPPTDLQRLNEAVEGRSWDDVVVLTRCRPSAYETASPDDTDQVPIRFVNVRAGCILTFRPHVGHGLELTIYTVLLPLRASDGPATPRAAVMLAPALDWENVDDLKLEILPWSEDAKVRAARRSPRTMQTIFDLHVHQWQMEHILKEDMVMVSAVYLFCMRAAHIHIDKTSELSRIFSTCIQEHDAHLRAHNLTDVVARIDVFFYDTQAQTRAMGQSFVTRLPDFLQMATSVGMGLLAGMVEAEDERPFLGVELFSPSARKSNMIEAIRFVSRVLDVPSARDDLSAALSCTMLHGFHGLHRMLKIERVRPRCDVDARDVILGEASLEECGVDCARIGADDRDGESRDDVDAACSRLIDLDHIAVTKTIFSARMLKQNVRLKQELETVKRERKENAEQLDAALKREAGLAKQLAASETSATDRKEELAAVRKELRAERRRSRKKTEPSSAAAEEGALLRQNA